MTEYTRHSKIYVEEGAKREEREEGITGVKGL